MWIVLKTVITVISQAFVVDPSGTISALRHRKIKLLVQLKSKLGFDQRGFMYRGANVNHSGETCLCALYLKEFNFLFCFDDFS